MYRMLDLKVVSGNVDGHTYSDLVEKVLLSHLVPFVRGECIPAMAL